MSLTPRSRAAAYDANVMGGAPFIPVAAQPMPPPQPQPQHQHTVYAPYMGGMPSDQGFGQVGMNVSTLSNLSHLNSIGMDIASRSHEYVTLSNSYYHQLCFYFSVTSSYVSNKIKLLIYPYSALNWKRLRSDHQVGQVESSPDAFMKPKVDINCPDLYIPSMSFVSLLLLVAWLHGNTGTFRPEILGNFATMMFFFLFVEVGLTKLGLYLINLKHNLSSLELISYFGYKYFGMTITLVCDIVFGSYGYHLMGGWLGASLAYFLMQSIRAALSVPSNHESQRTTNYVVFVIAMVQFLSAWVTLGLSGMP